MFGTLLETKARRERRPLGTVASVAVHAGVVLLAVWGTATADPAKLPREGPTERPIYNQLDQRTTSDAGARGSAGTRGITVTPPTTVPTDVAPVDVGLPPIPDGIATPGDTTLLADIGRGPTGPGGSGGGAGAGVADEWTVDERVGIVSERVPRYPEMLRAAGVEGVVVVRFVVDTAGRADPASLQVLESPHEQFTAAVLAALRQARFVPGKIHGRPVPTLVQRSFRFAVEGRP